MLGERPRPDRLEHVVIQGESLGVGPVVGDFGRGVVADHIGSAPDLAGPGNGRLAASPAHEVLSDETVHLSAVHIDVRIRHAMRAARVAVADEVVRPAAPPPGFRYAYRRLAVPPRDSRRAWVGSEV